jgi:hypothetical protein
LSLNVIPRGRSLTRGFCFIKSFFEAFQEPAFSASVSLLAPKRDYTSNSLFPDNSEMDGPRRLKTMKPGTLENTSLYKKGA